MSTDQSTDRVAVITGTSSGIGEATARALAADGFRLALHARRADRIQALAEELGNGAIAIEADVTDRQSLVAAAERVQRELGGADVLVTADAGANAAAAGLRAARLNASNSGPTHVDALDARARASRKQQQR